MDLPPAKYNFRKREHVFEGIEMETVLACLWWHQQKRQGRGNDFSSKTNSICHFYAHVVAAKLNRSFKPYSGNYIYSIIAKTSKSLRVEKELYKIVKKYIGRPILKERILPAYKFKKMKLVTKW